MVGLEYNEQWLIKGGILTMIQFPLKTWFHTTKVEMVPKPIDPEEEKKRKMKLQRQAKK